MPAILPAVFAGRKDNTIITNSIIENKETGVKKVVFSCCPEGS